jgi:hypothetical protein
VTRTDRLAATTLEILEAAADIEHDRARRRRSRRGIEAIDDVLEELEKYHLARRPRDVPLLPAWRTRLEDEGGLSIPEDVLNVHHTVHLHVALMTWQEELLNDAVPGRAELAQTDEALEVRERPVSLGRPLGSQTRSRRPSRPGWRGAA